MPRTRLPLADLVLLSALLAAAAALWLVHAQAWDLAGRSSLLDEASAPYAVAARRLAQSGRLETSFAHPIELTRHGAPPWPLAELQPGAVLVQGALFKIVPADGLLAGSDRRAALALLLPFSCFLFLAGTLALSVRHLFARWYPGASTLERVAAGAVVGLAFVLDPEAQHHAISAFAELPFATGLAFAFLGLGLGAAAEVPFVYGIVLGATGLFRTDMLWLAPVFAGAAAWTAIDPARTSDHRPPVVRALSTMLLSLAGYALVLAPWWAYKLREFGDPFWNPLNLFLWEGVGGRSAFAMLHVAEDPALPGGLLALSLLAGKLARQLPDLVLALLTGPRAMWIAALALWLSLVRPPRPLAAAGAVALAGLVMGAIAAALGVAALREVFAVRVLGEAMGALALFAVIAYYAEGPAQRPLRLWLCAGVAVIALGWGAWQTARGAQQARGTTAGRRAPTTMSIMEMNMALVDSAVAGEVVMSNLGATLAWQTNRPVVDLALTPEDVTACRRRLDFRHIVLAFRDADAVWPAWLDVFSREGAASGTPGLLAVAERRWVTDDGFRWVWLELPPLEAGMAEGGDPGAAAAPAALAGTGAGATR